MATKPTPPTVVPLAKGRLLLLLFFLLLLYVVVPRLGDFSQSFSALGNARLPFIGLAALFVIVTYMLAAGMYFLLALKPLKYPRTLLVQGASGFANRVLPAGLGVLTLYVQYLRKSQHTLSQALAVVSTNNLLGGLGHALLLGAALLITPEAIFEQIHLSHPSEAWAILALAAGVIVANLLVFSRLRRYLYILTKQVVRYVLMYRKRPGRLAAAIACSCLLTLFHVAIFYMCAEALEVGVSPIQAFVVFTIGVAAATITPTPGGLLGAEAGLTAGLVVFGVAAPMALAVALLYRFLTYWLPLLPGFILFITHRRLYL